MSRREDREHRLSLLSMRPDLLKSAQDEATLEDMIMQFVRVGAIFFLQFCQLSLDLHSDG